MNNENEIERMAKILYAPELKKQNGGYGEICRGCNKWYEDEPCKEKHKCDYYTEIARRLQKSGIGDKKQAVKEFAATLKERACAVMNSTFDRRLVVDIKQIDNLITELYGADE